MDYGLLSSIIHSILVASTPLVFAGLGALIQERAGVLNLGIEGLMIVGALAGFATAVAGSPLLVSIFVAALAGAMLASIILKTFFSSLNIYYFLFRKISPHSSFCLI